MASLELSFLFVQEICAGESAGESLLERSETAYDFLGNLNHELGSDFLLWFLDV